MQLVIAAYLLHGNDVVQVRVVADAVLRRDGTRRRAAAHAPSNAVNCAFLFLDHGAARALVVKGCPHSRVVSSVACHLAVFIAVGCRRYKRNASI